MKPKRRNPRKRNPRSEAAMREACKLLKAGDAYILAWEDGDATEIRVMRNDATIYDMDPIAIFDLRDYYRKRKPLKGVMKKLRKSLQGGGRKK